MRLVSFQHWYGLECAAVLACTAALCICGCNSQASTSRPADASPPQSTAPAGEKFAICTTSEVDTPGFRQRAVEEPAGILWVADSAALTQVEVNDAWLATDARGSACVCVEFTPAAREKLRNLTHEHLKQRLAIMFEEQVLIAPRIESEIAEGRLILTGNIPRAKLEGIVKVLHGE